MKKSLIALAALATVATAAQAQSSVTVYGLLDAGLRYQNNTPAPALSSGGGSNGVAAGSGDLLSMSNGNLNTSRLGFRGTEDLGQGLKANFTLEMGIKPETGAQGQSTALFDRRSVVGLENSLGKLDFGRNTNAGYDIAAQGITDANELAFDSVTNYTIKGNYKTAGNIKLNPINSVVGNTNLGTTRSDSMVKYSGKFDDVQVIASHSFGGNPSGAGLKSTSSGGVAYVTNVVSFGASIYNSKDGSNRSLDYISVGGNGTLGPVKVTASYNTLKADKDYKNEAGVLTVADYATAVPYGSVSTGGKSKMQVTHAGLTYQATHSIKTILAYYRTEFKGDGITKGTNDTFTLTGIYNLSKRTDVYASVDQSTSKDGAAQAAGNDKATGVIVGVRHKF